MISEDTFTNTVADAAAYEAYRSGGSRYSRSRSDDYPEFDGGDDLLDRRIHQHLERLVGEEIVEIQTLESQIAETGQDQPHPWTRHRALLALWGEDEDAFSEELEEYWREDAEIQARQELEEEAYNQP